CEKPVSGSSAVADVKFCADMIKDLLTAPYHAGTGSANLQDIFPNRFHIEHGVESSNFIDLNGLKLKDLRYIIHNGNVQPATEFLLCNMQDRDKCRFLFSFRISFGYFYNLF